MLAIKNNLMAEGAARSLGVNYDNLATSIQRLSSGLRINSAKDDAAGLAVRELLRADIAALNQGARNANDGVSMLQTAEGALGQVDSILIRMRELIEQANTDTYSITQKGIMQDEFDELTLEIDRIIDSTSFNGNNLMANNTGSFSISLGGGSLTAVILDSQDMHATNLGLKGNYTTATGPIVANKTDNYLDGQVAGDAVDFEIGGETINVVIGTSVLTLQGTVDAINVISRGVSGTWNAAEIVGDAATGYSMKLTAQNTGAETAINIGLTGAPIWHADVQGFGGTAISAAAADFVSVVGDTDAVDITTAAAITSIEAAIDAKDAFRAELGYKMNRLEAAASVLNVQAENLLAAESRISDVDVATEMSAMTRNQVLAQAGVAMLTQANSMPQMALKLLQ